MTAWTSDELNKIGAAEEAAGRARYGATARYETR